MSAAFSQASFDAIVQMVKERTGLGLQQRSSDEIERATRRAMQRAGVAHPDEFAHVLASSGAGWDDLIEEITIRETYFYRNPEHFELVRTHVLPALRRARGEHPRLRAWSAGCASGEEAYSLAMLLHQEQLLTDAHVLGSDICERALQRARTGRYRDWSLRGLDPVLANRYLRSEGNENVVREAVRTKVGFSHVNLADPNAASALQALGPMDLIFCRNVLIYFDAATNARVERALYDTLAPDGWLVMGPSDPVLGSHAPFEVITTDHGLLYRKGKGKAARSDAKPRPDAPLRAPEPTPKSCWTPAPRPPARVPAVTPVDTTFNPSSEPRDEAALAAGRVREVWQRAGAAAALAACDASLGHHVLHAELHYLRALAQMDLGCNEPAVQTLRRCLYLDRSLIIAHFTLGTLLRSMGDHKGARTAFRNVLDRSAGLPDDSVVALSDGVVLRDVTAAAGRGLLELEERG